MDYDHRHHAGNAADVWKHTVLLAALAAHKGVAVDYAETHAGRGSYTRPDRGEWSRGAGLVTSSSAPLPGAADRYAARLRKAGAALPGSPLLAAGSLGRRDTLRLWESDDDAAGALGRHFASDPRVRVHHGDGWGLTTTPAEGRARVILVDPPYSGPEDWTAAGDIVARFASDDPGAVVLLWLPIKRWTRPNALRARLRSSGVPAVHADLLWGQPEARDDLAGSGMTMVNVPPATLADCVAAGTALGPLLSRDGAWSVRAGS